MALDGVNTAELQQADNDCAVDLNLNDAIANPLADVFDMKLKDWTNEAKPSVLPVNAKTPIDPQS